MNVVHVVFEKVYKQNQLNRVYDTESAGFFLSPKLNDKLFKEV